MKRKRDRFELVPMDGWVLLSPGMWVSVNLDPPPSPHVPELQVWMRNLRGYVLSEVFGLENELILLELAAEFGVTDPTLPGRFAKDQELREEHSLERKIARAKVIIRQRRDGIAADRLIQQLGECREVRNLMAHYPCWMEPVNDEQRRITVSFKLYIGDRTHIWNLEEGDVKHWVATYVEVRRELIRLRHEVIGAEPPVFAGNSYVTVGSDVVDGHGTLDVGGTSQTLKF
jgi:hypothetical protein